jgi:hypothetical protein
VKSRLRRGCTWTALILTPYYFGYAAGRDLRSPNVDVFDEEMEHQVFCELLDVETLEEKGDVFVVQVGEPSWSEARVKPMS